MGNKAAFLLETGFCEREYLQAESILKSLEFDCRIVSDKSATLKAWNYDSLTERREWGGEYAVDYLLDDVSASLFDILVLPAGERSLNKLHLNEGLRSFMSGFFVSGKPVVIYNKAIELVDPYYLRGLAKGAAVTDNNKIDYSLKSSENLIVVGGYSDITNDLKRAITNILSAQYIDFTIGPENNSYLGKHKAA